MLMQYTYVGKHIRVDACGCLHTHRSQRKTVSIVFCLPSSCPFEAESLVNLRVILVVNSFSNLTVSAFPQS